MGICISAPTEKSEKTDVTEQLASDADAKYTQHELILLSDGFDLNQMNIYRQQQLQAMQKYESRRMQHVIQPEEDEFERWYGKHNDDVVEWNFEIIDDHKVDNNIDFMIKQDNNNILMFLSTSIKKYYIDSIFKLLKKNNFKVVIKKQIRLSLSKVESIFIDCRNSVDPSILIQNGMIKRFSIDSILVCLLKYQDEKNIKQMYHILNAIHLSFFEHETIFNSIYFTLNDDDYFFKYQSCFYHEIFWFNMKKQNDNTKISVQNKHHLNNFYDKTQHELSLQTQSIYTPCCCIPFLIYNMKKEEDSIQLFSKKSYQYAIERSGILKSNQLGYIEITDVMNIIWCYMGDSVCQSKEKEKEKEKNDETKDKEKKCNKCMHCHRKLEPEEVDVKKKVEKQEQQDTEMQEENFENEDDHLFEDENENDDEWCDVEL